MQTTEVEIRYKHIFNTYYIIERKHQKVYIKFKKHSNKGIKKRITKMGNKRHELIIAITIFVTVIALTVFFKVYPIITGHKFDKSIELVIILGSVLLIAAFFLINDYIKEKNRREKIKNYCFKNNIEFSQNLTFSDLPKHSKSCLSLNRGTNPQLDTLMKKQRDGLTFFLFDYSYNIISHINTGRKNNIETLNETVCLINKPNLNFPSFSIKDNEYNITNLEEDMQTGNLLKEDHDFCQRFHITSNSQIQLDLIFNKQIRESLKHTHVSGYKYEAKNDFFIVSKQGRLDLEERLKLLKQAMDTFAIVSANIIKQG